MVFSLFISNQNINSQFNLQALPKILIFGNFVIFCKGSHPALRIASTSNKNVALAILMSDSFICTLLEFDSIKSRAMF